MGSKENPFVVLEIVPNMSMASFGYLVSGQEPIDIEEAYKQDENIESLLGGFISNNESDYLEDRDRKSVV